MRTCNFGIFLLVLIMAAVGVGNSPVSADPCVVQLSSSALMAQNYNYYNSYIGVITPVSVTCSFVGGQLYAVGDTTDTSTNTHVGSASAVLASAYGVSTYTGQLVFSLPPTVIGHPLQISVSIYNGVIGSYNTGPALATAVGTVQVNSSNPIPYANCYATNSCNQVYNYCRPTSDPSTMQCTGYLYKDPNGCVELVISVYSPYGFLSYQYYTLQKLPASYPAIGTTVTVTGQVVQGSNLSSTGASCPGNYINVASISQ
jgi:hypothetical protein